MPTIQNIAATAPAFASAAAPSRRTAVTKPAAAPSVTPDNPKIASNATSLPPVGTACRICDAAHAVITTGSKSAALVNRIPRICSTTRPTRATFNAYSKVVMPGTVRCSRPPGVNPRIEPRVDSSSTQNTTSRASGQTCPRCDRVIASKPRSSHRIPHRIFAIDTSIEGRTQCYLTCTPCDLRGRCVRS
jgi:hypothetical protein